MPINSINNYNIYNVSANMKNQELSNKSANLVCQQSNDTSAIPFSGLFSDLTINKFSNKTDKAMYNELAGVLKGKDKANLDILYKTGRLFDKTSNDKSSTLENLYKIYKQPRAIGLDNIKILAETVERIANPFIINQKFGEIPDNLAKDVLAKKSAQKTNNDMHSPKSAVDMNVKNSACCVAASVEFSLADKKPAEFARLAEGFSSPELSAKKNVKLSNLTKNVMDSISLTKMFNLVPQEVNWDSILINIQPDRDAIIRARVQNTQYNGKNRSSVDVLMQSAFMQLGSQSTYNSLTDKRYGNLNANDTGLTEFEKTFLESVIGNDGEKTSVVYQNVDDNSILQGYFAQPAEVQEQIINTLNKNKNVIIGITETDENKKIIGGHEITVIGYKVKDGKLYFQYNDTDDNYIGALEIAADELIPKIHHAGIPVDIIKTQPDDNSGINLLRDYSKRQHYNSAA